MTYINYATVVFFIVQERTNLKMYYNTHSRHQTKMFLRKSFEKVHLIRSRALTGHHIEETDEPALTF